MELTNIKELFVGRTVGSTEIKIFSLECSVNLLGDMHIRTIQRLK
jgi:hypothetical protein